MGQVGEHLNDIKKWYLCHDGVPLLRVWHLRYVAI